eukprot:CAMPEP_0114496600 /NCGR_PEP_ID=MMETSP0109-20121206/5859_1 /TAXON_ID=29199 /ORGANISM="Chlorarachnion reptans, Strain CCCM449" /LENGTH=610 /DNA_ID=CAMNT_0001673889 /DNA_START=269 /DNA_END=2102 /DNA_ORIENTATION=+
MCWDHLRSTPRRGRPLHKGHNFGPGFYKLKAEFKDSSNEDDYGNNNKDDGNDYEDSTWDLHEHHAIGINENSRILVAQAGVKRERRELESVRWPYRLDPKYDADAVNPSLRLVHQDEALAIFYKPNGLSVQSWFHQDDQKDSILSRLGLPRELLRPAYQLRRGYGGLVVFPKSDACADIMRHASQGRPSMTLTWTAVVDDSYGYLSRHGLQKSPSKNTFKLVHWKILSRSLSWGVGSLAVLELKVVLPGKDAALERVYDTYGAVNIVAKELASYLSGQGYPIVGGGSGTKNFRALRGDSARGIYLAMTGIWMDHPVLSKNSIDARVPVPPKFGRLLMREARFHSTQYHRNQEDAWRLKALFSKLKAADLKGRTSRYEAQVEEIGLERVDTREAVKILEEIGVQVERELSLDTLRKQTLEAYCQLLEQRSKGRQRILCGPHRASMLACCISAKFGPSNADHNVQESQIKHEELYIGGKQWSPPDESGAGNTEDSDGVSHSALRILTPVGCSHDRSNHSEIVAMDRLSGLLEAIVSDSKNNSEMTGSSISSGLKFNSDVEGTVQIYVNHIPCVSCLGSFAQFRILYPKIQLQICWDEWRHFQRSLLLRADAI